MGLIGRQGREPAQCSYPRGAAHRHSRRAAARRPLRAPLGTPGYLPPEQLQRRHAFPAGDVYALGLLMHECLAGRPPWQSTRADELLAERSRTPVPKLPRPAGMPPEVEALYRRCLSPDPADRPPPPRLPA
uniref:protein kinase domain-containing protein n=1 Tax=Paractinoplanes polyasparticus TaxID=2856853 RepID=UPI001C850C1C